MSRSRATAANICTYMVATDDGPKIRAAVFYSQNWFQKRAAFVEFCSAITGDIIDDS